MGSRTFADIPRHVHAATGILTQRFLRRGPSISRLFDMVAIESVLYQIFLVETDLWTNPTASDGGLEVDFWLQAEKLLNHLTLSPDQSIALDSPVLGIPVSLFRLALALRQQYRSPSPLACEEIRTEVEAWEAILFCNPTSESCCGSTEETLDSNQRYNNDTTSLFIIVVSLLLEQVLHPDMCVGPPIPASQGCWQITKAMDILRHYESDQGWAKYFIANWPVYTLGFFLTNDEDKVLLSEDMQRRWDETRFAQVRRFRSDLDTTWGLYSHPV